MDFLCIHIITHHASGNPASYNPYKCTCVYHIAIWLCAMELNCDMQPSPPVMQHLAEFLWKKEVNVYYQQGTKRLSGATM